jgi:hypothetical protein
VLERATRGAERTFPEKPPSGSYDPGMLNIIEREPVRRRSSQTPSRVIAFLCRPLPTLLLKDSRLAQSSLAITTPLLAAICGEAPACPHRRSHCRVTSTAARSLRLRSPLRRDPDREPRTALVGRKSGRRDRAHPREASGGTGPRRLRRREPQPRTARACQGISLPCRITEGTFLRHPLPIGRRHCRKRAHSLSHVARLAFWPYASSRLCYLFGNVYNDITIIVIPHSGMRVEASVLMLPVVSCEV